tara:strand:+ start:3123 stop:3512 length:390 start_codon:yes stop_codon:yes gene_type:complete
MANKKTPVKAHRGFAHVRLKRRRPTGDPAPKKRLLKSAKRQAKLKKLSSEQREKMQKAFQKRFLKQAKLGSTRPKLDPTGKGKEAAKRMYAALRRRTSKNPNMTAAQKQRMIRSQNVRVAKGGAVLKKK